MDCSKRSIRLLTNICGSLFLLFGLMACSPRQMANAQTGKWSEIAKQQKNYIEEAFYLPEKGLYVETLDSAKSEKSIYSYLWPLCALIQAAQETDELGLTSHYLDTIHHRIQPYGTQWPPVFAYSSYPEHLGRHDRFYDDNQWIAIALLDAYKRTPRKEWLDDAIRIYNFQISGMDTVLGGGIYWNEGEKTSKNTCSNGPGALVALKLYDVTKNPEYLRVGRELYEWTQQNLQDEDAIYYDAWHINPKRLDRRKFSYNTGTMMESAAMLYRFTGESHFRNETIRLAEAAHQRFLAGSQGRGNVWFNAVLLRAYVYADDLLQNDQYRQAWLSYATSLSKRPLRPIGNKPPAHLLEEAAKLEIYALVSSWK